MRSILVVDDEADLVTTYERLLRRSGYRVLSTGSLREGLLMVEREPLGLVVADRRLPDGDGLEFVRAAHRGPTPVPSIVVSGFASEASHLAALVGDRPERRAGPGNLTEPGAPGPQLGRRLPGGQTLPRQTR